MYDGGASHSNCWPCSSISKLKNGAVLQQLPLGISGGSGSCPSSYQPPRSYTRDAGQQFQASDHPHRQFLWAISTTVFSARRTAATSSIGVGRRGTQNVQIHLSVAAHPEVVARCPPGAPEFHGTQLGPYSSWLASWTRLSKTWAAGPARGLPNAPAEMAGPSSGDDLRR